mmetsp:Transcript_45810/g.139156  ORF Transcript_45810/g.139156 Transcript_45810/m.139156 type:complete len:262 (+) Transcript_45810:457-1242(+)
MLRPFLLPPSLPLYFLLVGTGYWNPVVLVMHPGIETALRIKIGITRCHQRPLPNAPGVGTPHEQLPPSLGLFRHLRRPANEAEGYPPRDAVESQPAEVRRVFPLERFRHLQLPRSRQVQPLGGHGPPLVLGGGFLPLGQLSLRLGLVLLRSHGGRLEEFIVFRGNSRLPEIGREAFRHLPPARQLVREIRLLHGGAADGAVHHHAGIGIGVGFGALMFVFLQRFLFLSFLVHGSTGGHGGFVVSRRLIDFIAEDGFFHPAC